jgi:integrase
MSIHTIRLASGRNAYRVKVRTVDNRQYSQTFRTKKEAEAFEVRERAALNAGVAVDPWSGRVLFCDYAATWVAQRVALRPKTVELYTYLLNHLLLPTLGPVELRALSPVRVRAWQAHLATRPSIGPSTRAKAYRLLRTIMTTAVEDEIIPKNPCVLKGASVEHHDERPVATLEQLEILVASVPSRYRAMVLVAAWCGLRWGELGGLTRSDIDLRARTVRVRRQLQELASGALTFGPPKTVAGTRRVSIPPHVVAEIRQHLDHFVDTAADATVFTAPDGTLLRRSNFSRRAWQPACRAAGLDKFRFHDLWHTGNTLAATTGASTKELMARMGHASPRAALIYQHATPDRDKALADALSQIAAARLRPTRTEPAKAVGPTPTATQCSLNVPSTPSNVTPIRPADHKSAGQSGGDDGTRTHDPLLAKQVL